MPTFACRPDGSECRYGEAGEHVTPVVVPQPEGAAGIGRHHLTSVPLARPGLRVVSYNILADQYSGTEAARNVLFRNCPAEYVRI